MQKNEYQRLLFVIMAMLQCSVFLAQTPIEGYVFESDNRGFLNEATVTVYELPDNIIRTAATSDQYGHFSLSLPPGKYRIWTHKDIFAERQDTLQVQSDKIFIKMELHRNPGFVFEATLVEAQDNLSAPVVTIPGVTIELYNRTLDKSEIVWPRYTKPSFQHLLEQGTHYTLLINKPGYLTNRMELEVNVNGCVFCINGLEQNIKDLVKLADNTSFMPFPVKMERSFKGKRIRVPIEYNSIDKWDARPFTTDQLDKIAILLKNNPKLLVELSSHTDARGNDEYNLKLSQKRAESETAYLVSRGVDLGRIVAKGYGETQLVNKCSNGVTCTEAEHQANRRTEIKITGFLGDSLDMYQSMSLEQIVEEEKIAQRSKDEQKNPPKMERPAYMRPRDKQLPEANNSVSLPEITEAAAESPEAEESVESGAPMHRSGSEKALKNADRLKISPLDSVYTGYAIQVVKSRTELNAAYPAFKAFKEISWRKESDGMFYYYLLPAGPLEQVRKYYRKTIKPERREARLLRFDTKGKVYIK